MSESYTSAFVNKLIADFQKGEKHSSYEKLNEFVNKYPQDETARYNLACMCEELNYLDSAKNHYKKIIIKNSHHWKSKFNLYLIYIKEKSFEKALKLVNEVLKIKPNYQPALRDKAVILYYLKKPDEGLYFVEESLKQNQKDFIALNTLGLIYMEMRQYEIAKKIFKKSISLNPKYFPSYNNLGRCYEINNDRDSALINYKKALNLSPQFIEAINNIANCYNQSGFYSKAIEFYKNALKIEPKKPEVIYNMGLAYTYLGNYKKAEELYKIAYTISPNDDQLKKNYSILLLANQRFREAWKFFEGRIGLNEFRFKNSQINRVKSKLWKGKKIHENNKVLIIKEQGVGDEILYASMYGDLINKFHNVKIETDSRLISLFERSFNKKNIFVPFTQYSKSTKKLEQFETVLYAGSLGCFFRNKLNEFPKKNYLFSEENKFNIIKNKITKITKKIKIGISWRSKNETYGIDKSIDLNLFKNILKLNQFSFINLQYGDTESEIHSFKKISNINIISLKEVDLFNDFESIAALLKNLDLYIAVSNSTAHLAAALGVPTWIIKPKIHAVFHYWNQPGNTTPWYSSVRLFSYKNNWEKTIQEIKKELIKKFT